jgi:16S rRNA processing protein RimM
MARICVAKILNAHGIRGLVKLRIHAENIELLRDPNITLYRDKTSDDTIIFTLKNALKGDYLAEVKGVSDRNDAEKLRHMEVFMDEADLPTLDEDEVYHRDLVGLDVINEEDQKLGRVKAVQNFGAEDLLEIAPPSGNSFFLPYRKDIVLKTDTNAKHIIVTGYEDYIG